MVEIKQKDHFKLMKWSFIKGNKIYLVAQVPPISLHPDSAAAASSLSNPGYSTVVPRAVQV